MKKIIEIEIANFKRDTKIQISKNSSDYRIFNKLFCDFHSDTIWFDGGKLYKVCTDSSSDGTGDIDVFEINPDRITILEEKKDSFKRLKFSYLFVLILLAIFSSKTTLFFLVPTSLLLFLLGDKIEYLLLKIRFYIEKI